MSVQYKCDDCGRDGAGRVRLDVSVSAPHASKGIPRFDGELCPGCLQRLIGVVEATVPCQKV